MPEDQIFYVAQKVLIEKDGEILILNDVSLGLDLPGGKIQAGETDFLASMHREILEETGLVVQIEKPFLTGYFHFPKNMVHRHAGKRIFLVFYKAKFVRGDIILSSEHNKYKWVNKENYKEFAPKTERDHNILRALKYYFENE